MSSESEEVARQFPRPQNYQIWTDETGPGVILMKSAVSSELPNTDSVKTEDEKGSLAAHVVAMDSDDRFHHREPNILTPKKTGEVLSINTAPRGKLDSISSEDEVECRICQIRGEERLINPCKCDGSTKWVHEGCLVKWFRVSGTSNCELCSQDILIKKRLKPIRQWRRPPVGVIGGPCHKLDVWYVFLTLFSVSTVIGFAVFQVKIATNDAQTLGVLAAIYVLCGLMILVRVRYFYLWFVNKSFFWQKWKTLNHEWALTHKGSVCEPHEVSVV